MIVGISTSFATVYALSFNSAVYTKVLASALENSSPTVQFTSTSTVSSVFNVTFNISGSVGALSSSTLIVCVFTYSKSSKKVIVFSSLGIFVPSSSVATTFTVIVGISTSLATVYALSFNSAVYTKVLASALENSSSAVQFTSTSIVSVVVEAVYATVSFAFSVVVSEVTSPVVFSALVGVATLSSLSVAVSVSPIGVITSSQVVFIKVAFSLFGRLGVSSEPTVIVCIFASSESSKAVITCVSIGFCSSVANAVVGIIPNTITKASAKDSILFFKLCFVLCILIFLLKFIWFYSFSDKIHSAVSVTSQNNRT